MIWNQNKFPKVEFFRAMEGVIITDSELTQSGLLLTEGDRGWLIASPVSHNGDVYRRTENEKTIYGALSLLQQFGINGLLLSEKQVIERALTRADFKRIVRPYDGKKFDVAMLSPWPVSTKSPRCCAIYLEGGTLRSLNPELKADYNKPKDQFKEVCQLTDGVLADALRLLIGTTASPVVPSVPPEALEHSALPEERIATLVDRIFRDSDLARRVKKLHRFECQICGHAIALPDGSWYAEAHHIKPLGNPHGGRDIIGNILCVCPNHHAELDFGAMSLNLSKLRFADAHAVDPKFIEYHNREIYGHKRSEYDTNE